MDLPTWKGKGTGSLLNPPAQQGDSSPGFSDGWPVWAPKRLRTAALGGNLGRVWELGPKRSWAGAVSLKSHFWGSGRKSPGGGLLFFFFFLLFGSSVLQAQLNAAHSSSLGWMNSWVGDNLQVPRMLTTGSAQARLLRQQGSTPAQQAKC